MVLFFSTEYIRIFIFTGKLFFCFYFILLTDFIYKIFAEIKTWEDGFDCSLILSIR